MEMEVVFYVGIVVFVLFGPWILLWRVNRRRKSERLEDQSRWADLTARLYAAERDLKELRNQSAIPIPKTEATESEVQAAKTSGCRTGSTFGSPQAECSSARGTTSCGDVATRNCATETCRSCSYASFRFGSAADATESRPVFFFC